MLKPALLNVFIFIALAVSGFSQSVKFYVTDNQNKPLPGATVQLTRVNDSKMVYATTNNNGIAIFENLQKTLYEVKISYVGFETLVKSVMIKPDSKIFKFRLKEVAEILDEVSVVAKKPLIRQEGDKTIVEPETMESVSTNTLEVLESTPGLYVDQDNGIYLNSATPAKVYINGRELKMSNQDISILLQSLPPNSVKQIEIMRTPSAKYDAATSGGIINIVLKKGVKLGRFGSINGGMNQGTYGNRFAGFTFNDSGDKTTKYINANYNYNDRKEELNTNRYMPSVDTILSQAAVTHRKNNQFYTGYGIGYNPNDKTALNYDGRLSFSFQNVNTNNSNQTNAFDSIILSENHNLIENNSSSSNIQQDLSFNYKLDTIGSKWDILLGYNFYKYDNSQDYNYNFIKPVDFELNGFGDNAQSRHFGTFQTDLTIKLPHRIELETGVKLSYQYYRSNSDFFYILNETEYDDTIRSNSYNYTENINAAYLQTTKTFLKDLTLKAGIRMEQTYMNGKQSIPQDTSFIVNRADLFPYIYLSHRIIKMMGVELRGFLIYRRTINRPEYNMLNPGIEIVDQYLYETGNPELKPQFSDNIEFNISFNDFPVFAIGQNTTTDIFSEVFYDNTKYQNVVVRTFDNLGKSKETYLRGIVGIPPGGAYFFGLGGQLNINQYDGFYQGEPLQYTSESWRFFTFHVLKIKENTKFILSGFLMLDGQMGFLEIDDFGMLNVAFKQSFFNNKLNLTIYARDILRTMNVNFTIDQPGIYTYGNRYTDNQRIGIKLNYSFGINTKKDKSDNLLNMPDIE
ncbi:MAG: outer membrane beta-barrel family protein [Marinilabiliales bacterium]